MKKKEFINSTVTDRKPLKKVNSPDYGRLEDLSIELNRHKKVAEESLMRVVQLERAIHETQVRNGIALFPKSTQDAAQIRRKSLEYDSFSNSHESMVTLIGNVLNFSTSTVSSITLALHEYNDTTLRNELIRIPSTVSDNLDVETFSQIAVIVSQSRLTSRDAIEIYSKSQNSILAGSNSLWSLLTRMVLQRVKLIFMVDFLNKHIREGPFSNLATRTSPSLPSLQLGTRLFQREGKYPSHAVHSKTAVPSQRARAHGKRPRRYSSSTPLGPPSLSPIANSKNQFEALREELERSRVSQAHISDRIRSQVSVASSALTMGERESAKNFARLMAVRKLESVLDSLRKAVVAMALRRWRAVLRFVDLEDQVRAVFVLIAAWRMGAVLRRCLRSRLRRCFGRWGRLARTSCDWEDCAAACEIQRCLRGWIGRLRCQGLRRVRAAVHIQRIVRGRISRSRTKVLSDEALVLRAVLAIQGMWRLNRFRRAAVKLIQVRRRHQTATTIQRVFRGFRARRRKNKLRQNRLHRYAVVKIQSLCRRYQAVCRAERVRRKRFVLRQLVILQRMVRGFLARLFVRDFREMHICALTIQCAWRRYQAARKLRGLKRANAALVVQSLARGFLARNRAQKLRQNKYLRDQQLFLAARNICRVVLGYVDRRRYSLMLREFHKKQHESAQKIQDRYRLHLLAVDAKKTVRALRLERKQRLIEKRNARVLQRSIRSYVADLKLRRIELNKRNRAATEIQKVLRGMVSRKLAKKLEMEMIALRERNKTPLYYRLQQQYIRDQNLFHYNNALIVQCSYRRHVARRKVLYRRKFLCANRIQIWWRRIVSTWTYVVKLREMKRIRAHHSRAVVTIQKVIRGHLARLETRKRRKIVIIKWFLKRYRLLSLSKRVVENHRKRKRRYRRGIAAVTTLQARLRGWMTRQVVSRQYQKLVKQRERRRMKKRYIAATKIQSVMRRKLARRKVKQRKDEVAKLKKRKELQEQMERQVDEIHSQHLLNVQATQIQSLSRQLLAKNKKGALVEEVTLEEQRHREQSRVAAATRIQALARGVAGRTKYRKLLPLLRRAKQIRLLCAECERSAATKICRNCKDKFCEDCFKLVHKKGKRRGHDWTYVPDYYPASRTLVPNEPSTSQIGYASINLSANKSLIKLTNDKANTKKPRANVWEEFFDENTQTNYYFNSLTGETTWVRPL